jgi:hypothetical protein
MVSAEGRLLNVSGVHPNLVIPTAQIQLGEEARTSQFVKELINHGNWEHIAHRLGI